jgi:hypothetical protein
MRFNQVLLAYRYLQAALPRTNGLDQGLELLAISPQEACQGGKRRLAQPVGPDLDVVIPAGLRTGERFNLASEPVEIVIRPEGNLSVEGDDVWLTVEASQSLLQSGGRLEFSLFDQPHRFWLSKALAQARQIHLPGLGLPPRAPLVLAHARRAAAAARAARGGRAELRAARLPPAETDLVAAFRAYMVPGPR